MRRTDGPIRVGVPVATVMLERLTELEWGCLDPYLAGMAIGQLLRGFNAAYNDRRQRVLDGRTPTRSTPSA